MLNTPPAASRLGPAQTRRLRGPPPRAAPLSSAALEEERVVDAFQRTFAGVAGAQRCLASWLRLARGSPSFERSSELGLQSAHSYVEGLEARPWHDPATYAWLRVLEQHSGTIQKELDQALKPERAALLERTGESIWAPPARDDATAYGPQWRTLVLQDRGEWSPANAPLFPETTRLVRDVARAPSLEVFFARQAPNSGIAEHTDGNNFILTSHLGLRVPAGGPAACWLKVGSAEPRGWEERKGIVFDTSFTHSTWNASPDEERLVLLIRFWHPQLSEAERVATLWLFAAADDSSKAALAEASKLAEKRLKLLQSPKASGKGFGAKR